MAENAETLSPPTSRAKAAPSGSQAKTFTSARTGVGHFHPGKTSISKMSIRGMPRASIGMCTVRSDAHNVLQDKLIIVCAGGQFLVVVLQTDAA